MPKTQADIREHYEQEWGERAGGAAIEALRYSDAINDAVAFPVFESLLADLGFTPPLGRVLDVGSGSGRWIRFLLERMRPAHLVGCDFASASVELLRSWHSGAGVEFHVADITAPTLHATGPLEPPFDVINIANVLFHVPEEAKFTAALENLAGLVAPGGVIITTEFLPRTTMRTEWMLVRNRYEFESAVAAAGLRVCGVRSIGFFTNDPMGIDGPDDGTRQQFNAVRVRTKAILESNLAEPVKEFITDLLIDVEQASLSFARERTAEIDFPGQKLVALRRADS